MFLFVLACLDISNTTHKSKKLRQSIMTCFLNWERKGQYNNCFHANRMNSVNVNGIPALIIYNEFVSVKSTNIIE